MKKREAARELCTGGRALRGGGVLHGDGALRGGAACMRGKKKLENKNWEARKWREDSAGYMIRVTFAPAQKRRQTSAQYVGG